MGCHSRNTYIRPLVSPKRIILPLFYLYAHIFGLLWNPSLDISLIIILEYTSSNCVKLLDHLSDPQEPLINWISSEVSSDVSPHPVNTCFIFIHVHGISICIHSFLLYKGKVTQTITPSSEEATPEVNTSVNPTQTILLHSYAQMHTYTSIFYLNLGQTGCNWASSNEVQDVKEAHKVELKEVSLCLFLCSI